MELNKGWKPDFENCEQRNYFICYIHSTKKFEVIWDTVTQLNNTIYFKSEYIANTVIDTYPQLLK